MPQPGGVPSKPSQFAGSLVGSLGKVHLALSALQQSLADVSRRPSDVCSSLGNGRRFPLPRRNNSLIRGINVPALGVRAWGDITMTDSESWKERRNQVARYRVMEQETTDPLAARLLRDIVRDLEAEFEGSPQSVGLDGA